MPTFTVQAPDGRKIDIEAADQATAIHGAQQWAAANPLQAAPAGQVANGQGVGAGVQLRPDPSGGPTASLRPAMNPVEQAWHNAVGDAGRGWNAASAQLGRDAQQPGLGSTPWGQGQLALDALNVPFSAAANAVGSLTRPLFPSNAEQDNIAANAGNVPIDRRFVTGQQKRDLAGSIATSIIPVDAPAEALARGAQAVGRFRPPPIRLPQINPNPEVQTLRDAGVFMTPGQKMGGVAMGAEDKAMSLPILGDAIRGARVRGVESLNRAAANRALAPIGEALPANVSAGNDAVAHVQERLGAAYDRATSLIQDVKPDQQFQDALAQIRLGLQGQPPSVLKRFDSLLSDRVLARLNLAPTAGARFNVAPIDGETIKAITSDIGRIAANYGAGSGAERELGSSLGDVGKAVTDLAARNNPAYAEAVQAADAGWANFARLRDAASRAKNGVFSPSQLSTAVRSQDRSVGKGATARGDALMYDLSSAASNRLNSTIPDSGTAGRALFAGALGLGVGLPGHVGAPVAMGLSAAAAPYFLMGRKIATNVLRSGASVQELQNAEQTLSRLVQKAPELAPYHDQVRQALANVYRLGAGQSTARNLPVQ